MDPESHVVEWKLTQQGIYGKSMNKWLSELTSRKLHKSYQLDMY